LLIDKVEKTKLAALAKPQPRRSIRPGTDKVHKANFPSRYIPREVEREVWQRDGGQCAFVALNELRCRERAFLEFHHVKPYARMGRATVANISLRCRRHNQYEAELVFGPRNLGRVAERSEPPGVFESQ
jgi:5-methylcytosine-specific restriction endonuclease McrA